MVKARKYQDDIEKYAPRFELFFCQLRLLLSDNMAPLDDEITLPPVESSLQADAPIVYPESLSSNPPPSISENRKRPNSLTITTSSPIKVRLTNSEYTATPQTPDQPTIPKNPAFSGESTESTDEDNTRRMIGTLIDTALLSLRSDFSEIPWPKYVQACNLRSSGFFP
jgi:hypothetical protein